MPRAHRLPVPASTPARLPLSSYRLQLYAGFQFEDAQAIITYLAELGITECYCSPILAARPGSTHGYDICDHTRLNPELGTKDAFEGLVEALTRHQMGLLVDFVPNHMSADARCNRWWRSVLEHGPSSPFARFFDIDWDSVKPELKGKLLLPVLGNQYGKALEQGELRIDVAGDRFVLRYFDRELPLVLQEDVDNPKEFIRQLSGNGDAQGDLHRIHRLLEAQPYRLAYWRTASDEINYRRFFDVNELVGLRMEDPEVFDATHAFLLQLIQRGAITGVRLDHVDGLFDPAGYFDRLFRSANGSHSVYLLVEKILSQGEALPTSWQIHGTTGYDFLNDLNGIFVDARNAQKIKSHYERFTGSRRLFSDVVYESKKLIIATSMSSELQMLAHELDRISESDWLYRDFTLDSLKEALREVVACFPVYRTYVNFTGWSDIDRQVIDIAVARAQRRNPAMEPSIFAFLREMLLPVRSEKLSGEQFQRRLNFAMKFQQYTGPIQAKGLEDTAFYRYAPLLPLNEVGGDPLRFGRAVSEFHSANRDRLASWPLAMLATSTHDTKRGEDARARLNVLSEIPDEFRAALSQWARINASKRKMAFGQPAPDRRDEYFFYQALLGAWPAENDFAPDSVFVQRLQEYMWKAIREAKVHTSWINPNEEYDNAVAEFVKRALHDKRFLAIFEPFARRIAAHGMINSLAQTVLKITSPGVPDFYQGTELWDLSLVDPDNRRLVDFYRRKNMLAELDPVLTSNGADKALIAADLLRQWTDGKIKLYITASGLRLRRAMPELFLRGEYVPLEVEGAKRDHVVAFLRQFEDQTALVIVPRLSVGLASPENGLPIGSAVWEDTALLAPETPVPIKLKNIFTGEPMVIDRRVEIAKALSVCPVGLWTGVR